ncbi:hypothetical protein [Sphingobacterium faecium]|uniref:hypothetical protein n=1 Tax=Sphingobacterium faecium TaxID=34087 RepID=UPI003209359F
MKIYKNFIPLCAALFLSACSSNYLMTVNSVNSKKDQDRSTFLYSNDTVAVHYSFAGKNGEIYVKVENKSNNPIVWDLKNSALVINGKANSYADGRINMKGQVNQMSTFNDDYTYGYFKGTATLPKDVLLIPPHAYVDGSYFDLRKDIKELVSIAKKQKATRYGMNGNQYQVKEAKFNEDNSPYILRSFLSYSILNNNEMILKTTEQKFYAQTLFQTGAMSLNNVFEYYTEKGDMMAYRKIKGENALLLGGVAVLGAAAVALDDKEVK